MRLYSIYDSGAKEFLPPFVALNNGVARRIFSDFKERSEFIKFKEEFFLYNLGTFNSFRGSCQCDKPLRVEDVIDDDNPQPYEDNEIPGPDEGYCP